MRHLSMLGASTRHALLSGGHERPADGAMASACTRIAAGPTQRPRGSFCTIGWSGPDCGGGDAAACEAEIQAISGMMAVHGRDAGVPRRLGLDVASVAAGLVAGQGFLRPCSGSAAAWPSAPSRRRSCRRPSCTWSITWRSRRAAIASLRRAASQRRALHSGRRMGTL